jgi:tRNA modification GTPase
MNRNGLQEVTMKHNDDTIAAIATPVGEGAISVIRVSGKSAFDAVDRVFRGKTALKDCRTHSAHFGYLVDREGRPLDQVVGTVYKSPHSYTGEDCVEVSCHGGILVTRKVFEAILEAGARPAEPGEFTKRAFLNGRVDLSQAEAVADLIWSRSELSQRSSLEQLEGRLSNKINSLRERLLDACSLLELELDFVEEDIELTGTNEIRSRLESILGELTQLIASFSHGKMYREGVKVVIAGRPNVGKSSLLNALLGQDRAIVTEIAGTTRDVIEENVNINGILFRVVDTAGLRDSKDRVEREGVTRTEKQISTCDLILLVVDLSQAIGPEDSVVFESIKAQRKDFKSTSIVVLNKLDLVRDGNTNSLIGVSPVEELKSIKVSALTGEGIPELEKAMAEFAMNGDCHREESSITVTNARHKDALVRASRHLMLSVESLKSGKSGDFVAIDLRAALDYLGEIVGVVTTDEILDNIFGKFCIGK